MRKHICSKRTFTVILSIALLSGVLTPQLQALQAAQPQISTTNIPRPSSAPPIGFPDTDPNSNLRQQAELARAAMDERHKKMVNDADKLLALITELKAEVDKSTKFETSASAVRRAAEIEKLAHDVKERMRN